MTTGTILDDADLRAIRDALAAGKTIRLDADGTVEVSPEPVGAPMTAEAEAYIEAQLGDVKALVENGFHMTLHPAGQMFGASADGMTRIQGDADKALGDDDWMNIRAVLAMGSNVAILPDGTVHTRHHLPLQGRSEQQVAELVAAIEAKVADGSLDAEARAGRALTIADDGTGNGTQLRFAQSGAERPGIALPDDPVTGDPDAGGEVTPGAGETPGGFLGLPPIEIPEEPIGEHLEAIAAQLDGRAELIRKDALEDQVAESTRVGLERDEAARDAWMNQQGHEAAWQQARRELKVVQEATKKVADLEAKATADEASGRYSADHVEDLRQQALSHQARLDVARQRMESAQAEATRLGDAAAANRNLVTAAEERLVEITTQSEARIRYAELLEGQGRQVQHAAEALANGDEAQARGWLADARLVGMGEVEPADLVPDEPIPQVPVTSPSQVEDGGPVTSPSQVDDVTGADQAPAPAPEQPPATEQPAEQPADPPAAEQPAAEAPQGPSAQADEIEMPPDDFSDLRAGLAAADSVEADLQVELPEPTPALDDFADAGTDQAPTADGLADAGADLVDG